MLLIDSERLQYDIEDYNVDSTGKFKHWVQVQPTVDAIPVDVLREWLKGIPFHDLSNGKGLCVVCFKADLEKAIIGLMEGYKNGN